MQGRRLLQQQRHDHMSCRFLLHGRHPGGMPSQLDFAHRLFAHHRMQLHAGRADARGRKRDVQLRVRKLVGRRPPVRVRTRDVQERARVYSVSSEFILRRQHKDIVPCQHHIHCWTIDITRMRRLHYRAPSD